MLLFQRPTGFDKISIFLYSCVAYGAAWLGTIPLLIGLVNGHAFDWLGANDYLRYGVVLGFHAAAGAIGLAGVIAVVDSRDAWWVWPAAAFAVIVPALAALAPFLKRT